MEDKQIIEMFFNRNEDALQYIELQYSKLLFGIAVNITNSNEDANECVNDTYLKLWNTIPPQRPVSLRNYAASIVRNRAIDFFRKNTKEKTHCETNVLCSELSEILPDNNNDYDCLELKEILNSFLESLDKETRILFVKRYWQGESIVALARFFGLKQSTVKMKLLRTREKLRTVLEKEGIFYD